jgi:hypothetical protein
MKYTTGTVLSKQTTRRTLYWTLLAIVITGILLVGLGTAPVARSLDEPTSIYTRFATPLSSPTNNGGKSTWKIKSMTFASQYPNGFDFGLDISSSAGRITLARVLWRHSTGQPFSLNVQPDKNGKYLAHRAFTAVENMPQWIGIDYWWSLTDEHGNRFETPHKYVEYADNTRPWKRLVTEDVVIHWEASLPAAIGPAISSAFKEQREAYQLGWGKLLNYKPHIIIYASYKPWQEWQPGIDTQSVEGQTSNKWGATVQIFRANEPDSLKHLAYTVALHEMEHLYQQTYSPFEDAYTRESWFYEGDATYFEKFQYYDYLELVKQAAAAGKLPSLNIVGNHTGNRMPYDVGYAFWKFLEVNYGPDSHRKAWETIGKGSSIEGAIKAVTDKDLLTVEKEFREWVGATN